MDYFPLFAQLRQQPCLVVGGGEIAARKIRALRRAGAIVTVNAPKLIDELEALAASGAITAQRREFDVSLIPNSLLVIAATDDHSVNQAVATAARSHWRLCNVVDDGQSSSFIMPSVVDRSPIIVAVSSGGTAPMLARVLRQQLDDWLPQRLGALAEWVARWRDRVNARFSGHNARVGFWQELLDGPAASQLLEGRAAVADQTIARRLEGAAEAGPGEAWIVGAGPGDPGLLTRRAAQLLQRADVILHDALVPEAILDLARRDAEFVCVGKRGGQPSASQEDINSELVRRVRSGQRVCRLKGGDPFVFGRGGEELQALAGAGLPYQVVPGITAANGCAAYAGIPLTHRELATGVSLVTGHRADGAEDPDWAALAGAGQTLVIYMGGRRLAHICNTLISAGRSAATPAALVENGTTAMQRIIGGTLASLPGRAAAASAGLPSLLIVGEVAALTAELAWFNNGTQLDAIVNG